MPYKIRVGLPTYDGRLREETKQTLERLMACKDFIIDLCKVDGACIYKGRNISSLAVPSANDLGGKIKQVMPYDYYLAMDWDMSFGADNVARLIKRDKPIISAAYGDRLGESDRLLCGYFGKVSGDVPMSKRLYFFETGLRKVDWAGAGCLLIKKEVFETMDFPYWTHNIINIPGKDFSNIASEDVSFCMNAKAKRFDIWCDINNRVAHLQHPK
jgi:hypothetical protein